MFYVTCNVCSIPSGLIVNALRRLPGPVAVRANHIGDDRGVRAMSEDRKYRERDNAVSSAISTATKIFMAEIIVHNVREVVGEMRWQHTVFHHLRDLEPAIR